MAKNTPTAENRLPELVEDAGTKMAELQNSAADLERAEILAAGIAIGQHETFRFISDIGTIGALKSFETIKKSKAWRHIKNSDGQNFASLDDFCRARYGKSYCRLQEMTANAAAIGQEAFEQAERLGLRQSDYNVIKALPAPKQELIKEALAEGCSKEDVQRVLCELSAAHHAEISTLTSELEDAKARVQVEEDMHKSTKGRLANAEKKLKRIATEDPDAALVELTKEAQGYAAEALGMIRGRVRAALDALATHHMEHGGEPALVTMSGMVSQLEAELRSLRDQFNLADMSEAADGGDAEAWAVYRAHAAQKNAGGAPQ